MPEYTRVARVEVTLLSAEGEPLLTEEEAADWLRQLLPARSWHGDGLKFIEWEPEEKEPVLSPATEAWLDERAREDRAMGLPFSSPATEIIRLWKAKQVREAKERILNG